MAQKIMSAIVVMVANFFPFTKKVDHQIQHLGKAFEHSFGPGAGIYQTNPQKFK